MVATAIIDTGKKGETYEDVIFRLLDCYYEREKLTEQRNKMVHSPFETNTAEIKRIASKK